MDAVTPPRVVRGSIRLPAAGVPDRAAAVVTVVEDVSRADAPSLIVGRQRQLDVALGPAATLEFAVEVPAGEIDERSLYSVRVHVDVSGSGSVELGDLVTTRSYPVLTRGYGDEAAVEVRRV